VIADVRLVMPMLNELNDNQRALADYMSELSEDAYCAGWMSGLEYALWRVVIEGPRRYGFLDIDAAHIEHLRKLSQQCRGWIVFDDQTEET
jgi:hypothetical protein